MGRVNLGLGVLTFLLCCVVCYSDSTRNYIWDPQDSKAQPNVWCVARVNLSPAKLQNILDIFCSKLDCREIKPGGSCYEPNTLQNHASYALALNYRVNGQCPIDIAMTAITPPHFGKCHYP